MSEAQKTAEECLALINEVLRVCYDNSESWAPDEGDLQDLGVHLAYLALAISDQKPDSYVQWETCPHWHCPTYATRRFFTELFPESHPVWHYILPLYRGNIVPNEPG